MKVVRQCDYLHTMTIFGSPNKGGHIRKVSTVTELFKLKPSKNFVMKYTLNQKNKFKRGSALRLLGKALLHPPEIELWLRHWMY